MKNHAIIKGNENIEILIRKHRIFNIMNIHTNNETISKSVSENYNVEIQVLEERHICIEKREEVIEGTC